MPYYYAFPLDRQIHAELGYVSITGECDIALLLGGVNMIVYSIFATVSWFIIERAGRRSAFPDR